jgi:pimeloyl-ACP methyl ester carboxylesterase
MKPLVYYLTGMGGRLATGLGQAILNRGFDVAGRELVDEFRNFSFQDQIDTVAQDLQDHFWREDARVIANSFGAFLFLHAQSQLPAYIGKVLLLSPIVGEFANESTRMNFIPPRAQKLHELAQAGEFPRPVNCQIYVGQEDWQSNPVNVKAFGELLGLDVTIVPNAGHSLPKEYVSQLLDNWL